MGETDSPESRPHCFVHPRRSSSEKKTPPSAEEEPSKINSAEWAGLAQILSTAIDFNHLGYEHIYKLLLSDRKTHDKDSILLKLGFVEQFLEAVFSKGKYGIPKGFMGIIYSVTGGAELARAEEEKEKVINIFGLVAKLDRPNCCCRTKEDDSSDDSSKSSLSSTNYSSDGW